MKNRRHNDDQPAPMRLTIRHLISSTGTGCGQKLGTDPEGNEHIAMRATILIATVEDPEWRISLTPGEDGATCPTCVGHAHVRIAKAKP